MSTAMRVFQGFGLLLGLAALLGGCTEIRYVDVSVAPTPVAPYLKACAIHTAQGQRRALGSTFRMLQLDREGLIVSTPTGPVGRQPVVQAYDGTGTWWGRPDGTYGEWRRLHFHCLISPQGRVVYSFVRPE